jgi:hypothetical protein
MYLPASDSGSECIFKFLTILTVDVPENELYDSRARGLPQALENA